MTMYRLMIRFLVTLLLTAGILSAFEFLPYNWSDIILAAFLLPALAWLTDKLFAKLFQANSTGESAVITGLIIALIAGPLPIQQTVTHLSTIVLIAIASKYIITIKGRHLCNPAAFGALMVAAVWQQGASWWVGNNLLWPIVLIGGYAVVTKIRRLPIVLSFLIVGLLTWPSIIWVNFFALPILFFAFVMLVEPQTSPGRIKQQYVYGAGVALFWAMLLRFAPSFPYSLETSLVLGNILYWLMAKDRQMVLTVKKIQQHGEKAATFTFSYSPQLAFKAGQYLEWTLPHPHPDNRGIRRWFTISSSPTESDLKLTTTFAEPSSSFKTALKNLSTGETLSAAGLSGDFVLPQDKSLPLCFIAGGVGITPFRSMIKYLVDRQERRDIVLLYSNRTEKDILFDSLWAEGKKIGLKTVYTITDQVPKKWSGEKGYFDAHTIKRTVPDWQHRRYYVSGPKPMVEAFDKLLVGVKIPKKNIKNDFFPGYTDTHQA